MKRFIKLLILILIVNIMSAFSDSYYVEASPVPYDTYNYDHWDYIVDTPAAYYPDGSITGASVGTKPFSNPQDMCLDSENRLYISDTGNNRIVVVEADMKTLLAEITTFVDSDGTEQTFNHPDGVCVSSNNELYVCDTDNCRVVVLKYQPEQNKYEFVKYIKDPKAGIIAEDFLFKPEKITVDYANRSYIIVKNVFEGIMAFDSNGNFTGYFGTINVSLSFWDKFWRRFSTKAQRAKQILYIPTEYTGIDIDDEGFVYASYIDNLGAQAAMRLNPKGEDVINKAGGLGGDIVDPSELQYGDYAGYSSMVDIVYRDKGIYSLLDARRGRIFTYDSEGNLLYIFGGLGSQTGTFIIPTALEEVNDSILGLDAHSAQIYIYRPTRYGALINEAVKLRYDGDETRAVSMWEQVLKYNENFELANVGIGKSYLTAKEYDKALYYLKLGKDRRFYSVAFRRYRNEILRENLGSILTGLVIAIALFLLVKGIYKKKHRKEADG